MSIQKMKKGYGRRFPGIGLSFILSIPVAVFWGMTILGLMEYAIAAEKEPIKVGILHSLSGTMSISEVAVKDGELMAIDEINAQGGVLGRKIVPIIEDGASDWPNFAEKAKKLIMKDKVAVVFGCWTSASRKAVLPVFEKNDHLLFYPVQYEGLEASKNIIYTGATANQQIIPGVTWLLKNGQKNFYLLGSDYVFPRTCNLIVKAQLKAEGGNLMGEEYTPLGHTEYSTVINKIKASKADIVFNSLNGDSNVAFFKQLRAAGITPKDIPTMSVSIAEDEIRGIGTENLVGHLAVWNYFMSMDTAENKKFVAAYKAKYGKDRVTDDPIEANYFGVYLWAKAVEKAGNPDPRKVREAVRGLQFMAPEGLVTVDQTNNHVHKIVQVGRVRQDGQFDIIWSSGKPVVPDPFPSLVSKKKVLAPGKIVEQ
jgi:urea transport system substrate-binding protein